MDLLAVERLVVDLLAVDLFLVVDLLAVERLLVAFLVAFLAAM